MTGWGWGGGHKARTGEKATRISGFGQAGIARYGRLYGELPSFGPQPFAPTFQRGRAKRRTAPRRRRTAAPVAGVARWPREASDTLTGVNVVETILVYAVIPGAIYFVVGAATLRKKFSGTPRYRPGQPWEYPAMWWTANPDGVGAGHGPAVDVNAAPAGASTAAGGARGKW